jgi:uncharacterized SAM-dependent methyltransferase
MSILRNIHVARKYNVSPATVTNWIETAKEGKINLELTRVGAKFYIKDTASNNAELLKLKEQGAKFRSKSSLIKVEPDPKIYDIFTEEQLIDLIMSISSYNHIPVKYCYHDEGAKYWDKSYLESIKDPNSGASKELNLINKNIDFILDKFANVEKINLIDFGPGNSFPVKNILDKLISMKKLNNYVTIDTSDDMLEISSRNVHNWFGIETIKHKVDFELQSLRNILFQKSEDLQTRNLCVYFGATLSNNSNRLATLAHLASSLNENDYLWIATDLHSKQEFKEFNTTLGKSYDNLWEWTYNLLRINSHINTSDYEYNYLTQQKTRFFTMKSNVEINFKLKGGNYSLNLEKDRNITFMLSYKYSLEEILKDFSNVGLTVDQYNCDHDTVALFLARPKKVV